MIVIAFVVSSFPLRTDDLVYKIHFHTWQNKDQFPYYVYILQSSQVCTEDMSLLQEGVSLKLYHVIASSPDRYSSDHI